MECVPLNQLGTRWLKALGTGDSQAAEAFTDGIQPIVWACCRDLGVPLEAREDILSETMVAILQGLSSFEDRARFSSWAWTIAYRQTVNYVRRCMRDRIPSRFQNRGGEIADPNVEIEQYEQVQRLRWAVDQLPESWAQAIRLFYWQSRSTHEIAQTLKVKDGVVRVYLFRGRQRLRLLLQAG